ncbi:MAG: hypothetical protein IPP48_09775 [Chitinophagaceae bacterium]|nr:hypothetical protein [Chitinophagaceae bacterium]
MKKIFSFLLLTACIHVAISQTLFTYGTNAVSKEEFLEHIIKQNTSGR